MSANRSAAVMAQRSVAADGLDYYPTPPWGTRALCEIVLGGRATLGSLVCWEPACGQGDMARPLAEYFARVHASDIYAHGYGETGDYLDLTLGSRWEPPEPVDWVITNPPFNAALDFARIALSEAREGVALLCRTSWLESGDRYPLFRDHPCALICPFVERLPMVEGRLDRSASSATAYTWFVWRRGDERMRVQHIPPCKARFDRDEDWRRGSASIESSPLFGTFPTEAA